MNSDKDDKPNKITLRMNRTSSRKSCFIKFGDFLKEYVNEALYDFHNFEFLKLGEEHHILGTGASADVFLAKNKKNGKYYAIKQIDKLKVLENGMDRDFILREIHIHRRLIHENIVRLYSHYEDKTHFYLIMDYVDKGTLYQVIKMNNGLEEKQAFKYFIQAVTATHFLHENNLIHRDLKPENLLIDENGIVKLCDFGWCVELKIGNRITFCGTFEYMAPELIKELPYNQGVDVWSLGVLLYELIHGYSPFVNQLETSNDDYNKIFKNILKNNLNLEDRISDKCQDLIKKLLTPDNQNRIKIKDIFNHPWIVSYESDYKVERLRKFEIEEEMKKQLERKKAEIDEEQINVRSYVTSKNTSLFTSKVNSTNNSFITSNKLLSQNNFETFDNKFELKIENNKNDNKNNKNESFKENIFTGFKNSIQSKNDAPIMINNKLNEIILDSPQKIRNKSRIDLPKYEIEDDYKQRILTEVLPYEKENDSLFDKVLSQITTKNKMKRKKTIDSENTSVKLKEVDNNYSNNYSSNSNSISSKASVKLQIDRLLNNCIEIKGEEKKNNSKISSNTPRFSQAIQDDNKYFYIEKSNYSENIKIMRNDDEIITSLYDTDEKDISIMNNFNLLIKNNKNKKDPLSNGESRLLKEDRESQDSKNYKISKNSNNEKVKINNNYKISKKDNLMIKSESEYYTGMSTETNLNPNDVSTYDSNYRHRKGAFSIEMLERAKKNKNKISDKIEVIQEEKNEEGSFWSGFANFINPFKCDNK